MKITRTLLPIIGLCSMFSLCAMNNQPPKKFQLTTKAGKKAAFVNLKNKETLFLLLGYAKGLKPNALKKYEKNTAFLEYLLFGQEEKMQQPQARCEIASCHSCNESPLFFPGAEREFKKMIRDDQQAAQVLRQQSASASPHEQKSSSRETATQQMRISEISPLTRTTPPFETAGEFKFTEPNYNRARPQRPESAPVDLEQLDRTLRLISANGRANVHIAAHGRVDQTQPRVLSAVLEDSIIDQNIQQTPQSPAHSFVPIIEAKSSTPRQTTTQEEENDDHNKEEERQAQGLDDEFSFIFPGELEEIRQETASILRASLASMINTPHRSPSGLQSPQ